MKSFDFKLSEYYPDVLGVGYVQAYIHEPNSEMERDEFPSVVVVPGGSYWTTSEREAEPVAMRFYASGYNVFVLRYTTTHKPKDHTPTGITPYPICYKELGAVVDLIKKKPKGWYLDGKVIVVGFSAGGHLTATLSTRYDDKLVSDGRQCKPDATILVYPVITGGEFAHRSSFEQLTGTSDIAVHQVESVENYVHKGMSPVYICHAMDDDGVDVRNSLLFVSKLAEYKVDCECHVYPKGRHGFSTATNLVNTPYEHTASWVDEALNFLKKRDLSIEK